MMFRLVYELIDLTEEVEFNTTDGPTKITVDWGNAKRFIKELDERSIRVKDIQSQEDFDEAISRIEKYRRDVQEGTIQRDLIIECVVEGQFQRNSIGYLTNLLHQIFLALNLASPGSCDFYLVKIVPLGDHQDLKESIIQLSSGILEGSVLLRDEFNWPSLEVIEVEKVWGWIRTLNLSEIQFARSNTERAIFALLHTCIGSSISPTDLLWLAHALEALYDTPELGISKALRDRIFLVLGKPSEDFKKIRQAISKFYGLRSQFVHGNLAISNPMIYTSLNTEFDNHAGQLIESFEIAALVILATLQKLILNNWSSVDFSEQYFGCPI